MPQLTWYTSRIPADGSIQNQQQINDGNSDDVVIVDSKFEIVHLPSGKTVSRNSLIVPTLSRLHFAQPYRCQAQNNNMTDPVSRNLTIDMRREPSKVENVSKFPAYEIYMLYFFYLGLSSSPISEHRPVGRAPVSLKEICPGMPQPGVATPCHDNLVEKGQIHGQGS